MKEENQMMTAKQMAAAAYKALDEKKAYDIRVIDISKLSTIADYFIIADGNNISQVEAMADSVRDALLKEGAEPKRVEGAANSGWILMDYGDVIVHVFGSADRVFYDLERIWRDGRALTKEELLED